MVQDAFEDALGFAASTLAAVDVVAAAEGLDGGSTGAEGVGDPVVALALVYPLPDFFMCGFSAMRFLESAMFSLTPCFLLCRPELPGIR